MSKRKQRSTAIRKRIEKKQREEQRAKKKASKGAAGQGGDVLVAFTLGREQLAACHAALTDLEARLGRESLRGWSGADLQGTHGLAWFGRVLGEALGAGDADPVQVELFEVARAPLLERLGALELAASGLKVAWDEAGFDQLVRALAQAAELEEEEEEEEAAAPAEATASGDDVAASGETAASGDDTAPA